jgi:1,3-beta-glucan synthase
LILLLYITLTIWTPYLIYFWITVLSLAIAPFLFNPHQFSFSDFVIDYRELLRWMSRGNSRTHANSWVGYCRLSRTRITGFKRKRLGLPSEKLSSDVPRAPWRAIVLSEILAPLALAIIFVVAYLFVKSFPVEGSYQPGLLRIAIISLGPIVFNMALLIVLFLISLFLGPCVSCCCRVRTSIYIIKLTFRGRLQLNGYTNQFGAVMAAIAHFGAVVGLCAFFEFLVSACSCYHRRCAGI